MVDLLKKDSWLIGEEESKRDFVSRIKLQDRQFVETRRLHGHMYMLYYEDGDVRPMREDQISITELKAQIRTPLDTEYDCPLCQPYDRWEGLVEMDQNRRYLCKIVSPKYLHGSIEEVGIWKKCPCVTKPKNRKYLKFKQ